MNNPGFKVGEYIVYINGDTCELGRIKRLSNNGAYVWYSEGETAANTPFDHIHKLSNEYLIKETYLGGNNVS